MKRTGRCCYCLKQLKGRGKDAPTPEGILFWDDWGDWRCCEECYGEKSGWSEWYRSHEC